ncbi:hypothetical protein KJ866_02150 [Patescibacteria group bacterium]|nr:hypothetical protein [Patescibacteria group bacterium]MBU2220167.1 hypothetical protein [Patescibacteria group bacterium]MBU2265126.1 hypothetical protein [Patescibacteria group bacterium]
MGKLSVGQKVLRSAIAVIFVLLPLMACTWVATGSGQRLEKTEIAVVFILPIAFVVTGLNLIRRAWK